MKCVKDLRTEKIIRVSNDRAAQLVATKQWKYTSKKDWKDSGRARETTKMQVASYSEWTD